MHLTPDTQGGPYPPPPKPRDRNRHPADPDMKDLRVLVVDDNCDFADSVAMLLALRGIQARAAYSASQAVAVAAGFRPSVAVLDLHMPETNGFLLARQLRGAAFDGAPRLRLVAQTGSDHASLPSRCGEAGFVGCLLKPYDIEKLITLFARDP